jgi:hypothetical protein
MANGLHGKNLAQSETLCTWRSSLRGTWEDSSMPGLVYRARAQLIVAAVLTGGLPFGSVHKGSRASKPFKDPGLLTATKHRKTMFTRFSSGLCFKSEPLGSMSRYLASQFLG